MSTAPAAATAEAEAVGGTGIHISHLHKEFRMGSRSVVALDDANLAALRRLSPAGTTAQLRLLMDVVDGRRGQAVDHRFGLSRASRQRGCKSQ